MSNSKKSNILCLNWELTKQKCLWALIANEVGKQIQA